MSFRWLCWLSRCLVFAASGLGLARADLVISEFMARNIVSLADKTAYPDWIELHNTGPDPVELEGWYLTDSPTNLTKWRLPAQSLAADGYLVVFASGKNVTTAGTPWHTNFKLASGGGYLALVRPGGQSVAADFGPAYPPQWGDVSFGPAVGSPGAAGAYFERPTPRGANAPGWPVRAAEVTFSVSGGPFKSAFNLALGTTQTGGEIHYTMNGAVPTADSPLYSGPLVIDRTVQVRARVLAAGHVPGPVAGEAYTLVGASLQNFSSNLPLLVIDTYGATIAEDSRARGTLTLLRPSGGRTTLTGAVDFHGRGSFEIRGSSSTRFPKHSYGLELRGEDDADRPASLLGLPEESDWVLYAPYTDKTLIRDVLAYELSNRLGRYAPRTRFVELYVNRTGPLETADYQGIYVLIEKIKGGPGRVDIKELEATDYTAPDITGGFILKKDRTDGNDAAFTTARGQQLGIEWPRARDLGTLQTTAIRNFMNQFETALNGSQFRNPQSGYQAYIDPDSFVDHWWLVEVAKNIDGYRLSTFMFKDRGARLNLGPIWDYNLSFGNADYNEGWLTSGWYWPFAGGTDYPWFPRLFQDPDFTQRHADRWISLRTNVLATANVISLINVLTNELAEAQVRNFQKWPSFGQYIWPNWYIGNSYADEIGFLKRWVTGRLAWIDTTIVRWPEMSPGTGYFPQGITVTLKSSLPVFYTLDGTDPRSSGGALSSTASSYTAPLVLSASARVIARARNGSKWSPPVTGSFAVTIPPLRISELMYHPPNDPAGVLDSEDFEYVELRNLGEEPLDLAGVVLSQGIQFVFPANAGQLLPGENILVVRNRAAFTARYGEVARIAGEYSGKLDNAGERLALTGAWGEPIEDFTYDDAWEPTTDGNGYSLTRSFPIGNWRAGAIVWGTPGRDDVPAVDLHALQVERVGQGELRFSFPAAAGQSYSLQSTTNLAAGPWTTLGHVPPAAGSGTAQLVIPEDSLSSRVFRVVTPRTE